MHLPSSLTPFVAFLALLTKATAQDSAPFELKSQVLLDGDSTFNGLYFTAFSYHPGGFYYATLSQPSDNGNPALVSVLTGPTGNQTLKTTNLDGYDAAYIAIGPGSTNAPAIYDSVTLRPDYPATYGFTFVDDVLTWNEVAGEFYACLQNPAEPPNLLTPPAGTYRLFYEPAGNPTYTDCFTLQLIREPTS